MSAHFDTILILGATSGIGEGIVRRYHAEGKTTIAAGRRMERLEALQKELKGLHIRQIDIGDITSLPQTVSSLLKDFPKLDTIIAMAGIQKSFSFADSSTSSPASIATEVTTNITAPMILAHLLIPHLLSLSRPTSFILVSSGLAYIPVHLYPVYCPTKAAIHTFAVMLRAQMKGTGVRVVELAPPYVDTGLDAEHRESVIEMQGGEEKAVKPMGLEAYLDTAMEGLRDEERKEVATGFSEMGVGMWRGAFGGALKSMSVDG